jgi:hypothetical protein
MQTGRTHPCEQKGAEGHDGERDEQREPDASPSPPKYSSIRPFAHVPSPFSLPAQKALHAQRRSNQRGAF